MTMDGKTFDRLTMALGAARDRRSVLGGLAALGAAAAGARAAAAQDEVEAEGDKCPGKTCKKDANCGKGLYCNLDKEKCEYKKGNHGKKGDTCCGSPDCKGSLKCVNNTCKRNR